MRVLGIDYGESAVGRIGGIEWQPICPTDGPDAFVQFKQEYFNYDGPAAPLAGVAPGNIGFAGFRIFFLCLMLGSAVRGWRSFAR